MDRIKLKTVANALVEPGKGILAADEGNNSIKKRFDPISVKVTETNRRLYRQLLFTTEGIEQFISGVILSDDMIRSSSLDDIPFATLLSQKDILPGINVDKGPQNFASFPGEKVTDGLDGLRTRIEEYRNLGAQFAKWRAVISIGDRIPSRACLEANAESLARYAALCQESNIVPIIEPDILMEGGHTIDRCEAVTLETLRFVFNRLCLYGVYLEGIILKPNMVLPGNASSQKVKPEQVAEATLRVFRQVIPVAVPGIAFLSGGQKPVDSTVNLNAINMIGPQPWRLSFSFARALQEPFLAAWAGKPENTMLAQQCFYHRAKCNSAASQGKYLPSMEMNQDCNENINNDRDCHHEQQND